MHLERTVEDIQEECLMCGSKLSIPKNIHAKISKLSKNRKSEEMGKISESGRTITEINNMSQGYFVSPIGFYYCSSNCYTSFLED